MPLVRVEIEAGRSAEHKRAILDGVHAALVEALRIPEDDRNQRLFELPPDAFEVSGGKSRDAVFVEITMFAGRSREAKRRLFAAIARNLADSPGIAGDEVVVVCRDVPRDSWGIRGGCSADEVDLGFEVEV